MAVDPDGVVRRRVDRVEQTAVRDRNWLVPALLTILLIALAAIAAAWYFSRSDEADVPSVVGLPVAQAVERLQEDGFDPDITTVEHESAEPGTVFDQRPNAGQSVDEGSTVEVFASSGPGTVPVPDTVGMQVAAARTQLETQGFEVTITRVADDGPSGVVLKQAPEAGATLSAGDVVGLTVSAGRQRVTVPNAVGLEETEARDKLAGANLQQRVVQVFSDEPAGTVVAQQPAAGSRTAPETTVVLRVSKGSASVDVPSLVGSDRDSAEAAVEAAGLVPNVVEVPSTEPAGTVVAQHPTGGTANRGSTVRLNVSSGVPPTG